MKLTLRETGNKIMSCQRTSFRIFDSAVQMMTQLNPSLPSYGFDTFAHNGRIIEIYFTHYDELAKEYD